MVILILSSSKIVPDDEIRNIVKRHRLQTIKLDIILSDYNDTGRKDIGVDAIVLNSGNFNLAKARNSGAYSPYATNAEYLIFSDIDTYYHYDVFEKMIDQMVEQKKEVIRGISRINWPFEFNNNPPNYYKCSNSPMIINRSLFLKIGGYCNDYIGWGYEDSDFEHKLIDLNISIIDYDSKATHDTDIHNYKETNWNFGSDNNRKLLEERLKTPISKRVKSDMLSNETIQW